MTKRHVSDFLIIGGGIVGYTIAAELQRSFAGATVCLIEKEDKIGLHASGRNSGVLHSGIYYPSDSYKSRFTKLGNEAWVNYCRDHDLYIDRCGKLLVMSDETQQQQFDLLVNRAKKNHIKYHLIEGKDLSSFDSRLNIEYPAIYVPSTATIDPIQLLRSVQKNFIDAGGKNFLNCKYIKNSSAHEVDTSMGKMQFKYLINCAGLYADKIAHDFGFGSKYSIVPFRGLYLYSTSCRQQLKQHIYPIPDLKNPFLGVHFTRTIDDKIKVGPTAFPALWREHYQGLENAVFSESSEIIASEFIMLLRNKNDFRSVAVKALLANSKAYLKREASKLLNGINEMNLNAWGMPGIRAQLINKKSYELEMDFVVEGDDSSIHILNAVSPAFTCALPFSEYIVSKITKLIN